MAMVKVRCELWPLVVTELGDNMGDDDTLKLLSLYEDVLSRKKAFVGLVDLSGMTRPPRAQQRQLIADWSERNLSANLEHNMGSAIVVPNGIVRGALTALCWIFRSPLPQSFEPTMVNAVDWCMRRMAESALPNPLSVHELRMQRHCARLSA